MARCRSIKPGFMTNERLPELGAHAHLLFACLWMVADREGRLEDRPKKIKGECMPHYDVDVDKLLAALASGQDPFIRRYRVGDKGYIQIVKWKQNQSPHHTEKPSVIPASPLDHGESQESHGELTSVSLATHYQQPVTSNQELEEGSGEKPKARFEKPTIDQVREYAISLEYTNFDAEKFWHHHNTRGWRTREGPMRSWKSAVVTWHGNEKQFRANHGTNYQPNRNGHTVGAGQRYQP